LRGPVKRRHQFSKQERISGRYEAGSSGAVYAWLGGNFCAHTHCVLASDCDGWIVSAWSGVFAAAGLSRVANQFCTARSKIHFKPSILLGGPPRKVVPQRKRQHLYPKKQETKDSSLRGLRSEWLPVPAEARPFRRAGSVKAFTHPLAVFTVNESSLPPATNESGGHIFPKIESELILGSSWCWAW
jgi:hypothetical protein